MRQPSRAQRGVTLVEACTVCAVLAIVAGLAAPSFNDRVERQALQGAAAELETDLQFARASADALAHSVWIEFQPLAAGSCYVVHAGAQGDCRCGDDGLATCSAGRLALRSALLPADGRVRLQANVDAMRFDAYRHTVSPSGSVTLSDRSGHQLREVVNILGRIRACSPSGGMPGYAAC